MILIGNNYLESDGELNLVVGIVLEKVIVGMRCFHRGLCSNDRI